MMTIRRISVAEVGLCPLGTLLILLTAFSSSAVQADAPAAGASRGPFHGVRRVVFLGDSITHSGLYVAYAEAYLRTRDPSFDVQFINVGLSSETVSGLSEPGHAGGQFPRPDLHERLERVLAKTKPDLVVACYGMNCGIYHPLSEDRFAKYQAGMELLRDRAKAVGGRVLHLTPPVFDPVPIEARTLPAGQAEYRQPYAGYNEVLDRYSEWLLSKRADGWEVVDLHGPMNRALAEGRRRDPAFRFAGDGVHPNAAGHWLMARELLLYWGAPAAELTDTTDGDKVLATHPKGAEVLKLIQRRQSILHDAWLTATGHERPGVKAGLPLPEAEAAAAAIDLQIVELLQQ